MMGGIWWELSRRVLRCDRLTVDSGSMVVLRGWWRGGCPSFVGSVTFITLHLCVYVGAGGGRRLFCVLPLFVVFLVDS